MNLLSYFKNHSIIFVCLISIFFGAQTAHANAQSWILKNPLVLNSQLIVKKEFHFKENTYLSVETLFFTDKPNERNDEIQLQKLTLSEVVFPDLEIGLTPQPAEISKAETQKEKNEGWHRQALQYNKIPDNLQGQGIVVAVLDTGVDYTHTALAEKIWRNPNEIPINNIDDDNNGYIDDVYGYNFVDRTSDPMDYHGHGTHCAGIITSSADSENKTRGIAPAAKIMSLKILDRKSLLSDAAEAIIYATDNGAHILSNSWRIYNSWSDYYNQVGEAFLKEALRYAADRNVIFVAAAGNENKNLDTYATPMLPGGILNQPLLVTVASTQQNNNFSSFSNYGEKSVHVAAPGSDIYSTYPNNRWKTLSGTSMATPIVSGLIALGLQSGLAAQKAIDEMMRTSTPIESSKKISSGGIISPPEYLNVQ